MTSTTWRTARPDTVADMIYRLVGPWSRTRNGEEF